MIAKIYVYSIDSNVLESKYMYFLVNAAIILLKYYLCNRNNRFNNLNLGLTRVLEYHVKNKNYERKSVCSLHVVGDFV